MRNDLGKVSITMMMALEALYLHRTTTLAAEKMGISQPSISGYLKLLRELTGDEMFVRTAGGYEPTDFCKQYYGQVREILDALEVLAGERQGAFDPCKEAAEFSIAIPFYKTRMLLEALSVNLMRTYPLQRTNMLYLKQDEAMEHLESGQLDVYLGMMPEKLPKAFRAEKIWESEFIVLCSDKCRFFETGKISKADFIETPHINLSAGFVPSALEKQLEQHGLLRRTMISVPDIGSEIILLRETGNLLLIDQHDADIIMAGNNFRVLEMDFSLPQLPLYIVWHMRKKTSPAHKWFRDYVRQSFGPYKDGHRPDPSRFMA